jgi:hypothetical protein
MCGKITPEKRGGKKKEQIKIKQDATNVREDHILKNRKEKQMNKKGCQNTRSFWLTQKKKKKEVLVFPKKNLHAKTHFLGSRKNGQGRLKKGFYFSHMSPPLR